MIEHDADQAPARRMPSLQRKISVLFLLFGLVLALGLTIQGNLGQQLVVHPIWQALLQSSTDQYLGDGQAASGRPLPARGVVRGWHLRGAAVPGDMPAYFARLGAGYYDESQMDAYDTDRSHAVLVTPVHGGRDGRVVMAVDITDFENYQNRTARVSAVIALLSGAMILGAILWLHASIRRPARALAQRMGALDPEQPSQRLPTDFSLHELQEIALMVNRHLERVERSIERERSLLDQASHEFRTPIAVIAGAVDVLRLHALPPAALRPLERIATTTRNLSEIMAALLFLAREGDAALSAGATRIDTLTAELVDDHAHLLQGDAATFVVEELEVLAIACPEAVVRIVVGNLLRNAAENCQQGAITVSLVDGCLRIRDSGAGFDMAASARRYKQALRDSTKPGGGLGLGLFLTRRICERFGWSLKMSSEPGSGTLAALDFSARRERA